MNKIKIQNLRVETLRILGENNRLISDIHLVSLGAQKIVGTADYIVNILFDVNYNGGYGYPNIPTDLKVVGKDFILTRYEYDGCEGWEFTSLHTQGDLNITNFKDYCDIDYRL